MRKNVQIKIGEFRLQPVDVKDAEYIIKVRTSPSAKGKIHETDFDIKKQEDWIKKYLEKENDYYFTVNYKDEKCGTVGLYDIHSNSGEWGRWIVLNNPFAALASAIMICEFGFNYLKLEKIYGNVVEHNKKVLSFHKKFGMTEIGRIENATKINGLYVSYIHYELLRKQWEYIKNINIQKIRYYIGTDEIICI
jgi:RimJ/RimL family protein N-acetyltransferase